MAKEKNFQSKNRAVVKQEVGLNVAPVVEGAIKAEKLRRSKGGDYRSIYANSVSFGYTQFDVYMIFGEVTGADGNVTLVNDLTTVKLNPAHAKVFSRVLQETLQKWEASHGEIKMPTGTKA